MNFYTSVFKNSKKGTVHRTNGGPGGQSSVTSVTFQLNGQEFMALNGGPTFSFTPAISMFVSVETQEEVDELWDKLSEGGEKGRCGWLKDKYGLSWQIVPTALGRTLYGPDKEKAGRAMKAMMQMGKIVIRELEEA